MSVSDVYALLRGSTDEHKCVVSDHLSSSPSPPATCCTTILPQASAEQWISGAIACRFAGLALLPRVCSSDAEIEYHDVYESISVDFLWRLLVPLRDPRFIATIDSPEDVHKQFLGAPLPTRGCGR